MVPRGDGTYIPHAGSEYLELRQSGSFWTLRTLDNLEYTFSPIATNLWQVTEIRDLVGTDHVELTYTGQGDLLGVSYTYSHDKVPLYEINLVHESFNGAPFERVKDDERSFSRSNVLKRVEVRARNNHAPALDAKVIRAYHLEYAEDPDTGKPRLREVTVSGEEDVPGGRLPVAQYIYGSLTSSTQPNVAFGPEEIVSRSSLPTAFQYDLATTSTEVEELTAALGSPPTVRHGRREWSRARHMLRDFTGDGLPDLLYKEGDQWSLVANRLDSAGNPHLDGPVTSTWTQPAELQVATTFRYVPPTSTDPNNRWARQKMITTDTWTTFVDWNGDGRLDIVDAGAGAFPVNPEDSWRVWINQPTANGGIQWRPFDLQVANLRDFLDEQGLATSDPAASDFNEVSDHLPLSRTRSWPRVDTWTCRSWDCTPVDGGSCSPEQACDWAPDWFRPEDPAAVDSMTDWDLADTNGDSYPDFVALDMPVRQCELSAPPGWWATARRRTSDVGVERLRNGTISAPAPRCPGHRGGDVQLRK